MPIENFFLSVPKIGQYFMNFEETISSNDLDAISIILNGSLLDARFLIQVERNEKAFERTRKKMMRARSTLDWSQSKNKIKIKTVL